MKKSNTKRNDLNQKNTLGWENNFCEKKKFFAGDLTREARNVPMVVYLHWPRPARSPAFNWLMKQCVRRYLSVGLDSHEKSHITYKIIPVSHTWTINKSAGVETWLHLSTCRPSLWWLCGRGGSSSPGWTTERCIRHRICAAQRRSESTSTHFTLRSVWKGLLNFFKFVLAPSSLFTPALSWLAAPCRHFPTAGGAHFYAQDSINRRL